MDNVLRPLKEESVTENKRVTWIGDNGPMYALYAMSRCLLILSTKGDVFESAVWVVPQLPSNRCSLRTTLKNFQAFVQLGCMIILPRQFADYI